MEENKSTSSGANPNNFWVSRDGSGNFIDGPRLIDTINNITAPPSVIVWLQGEQDATRAQDMFDKDNYRDALDYVFTRLKSEATSNVIFGICVTGRRKNSSKEEGIQLIRQAQHELADIRSDVVVLSETYDLEMADHVHYSQNGQEELLDRVARNVSSYIMGNDTGFIPKIKAVNLNANDKTKLLVEIENVQDIIKGSNSNWLFSAHSGSARVDVLSTYGISESLVLVTLNSPITTIYTLHVGNGKYINPVDISTSGSYQIRNEYLFPIASGIYEIDPASW